MIESMSMKPPVGGMPGNLPVNNTAIRSKIRPHGSSVTLRFNCGLYMYTQYTQG